MAENYGTLEGTLDEHGVLSGEMSDRATLDGEIQFSGGGGGVLDVFQNGQSVVEGRKAYVTVPTLLRELRSDDYHNTVTALEMQIWNGKANPSDIPTKLSQLDNDDNYVQDADYVHTDNNFTNEDKDAIDSIPSVSPNPQQTTDTLTAIEINGVGYAIEGGGSGAVTSVNGQTGDVTLDAEDVGALPDDTPIPTVNNPTITIQKNGQNVDTFTLNQTANKVIDIPVPTKTSDLQNDSSFITNTVNNLANYYLKSQTYTQAEVDALIDAAVNGRFQKVNVLPATGEPNIIYLVPKATPETSNACDEYIWQDNDWELIGSTDIDLSGYVTDDELTTALQDYLTTSAFNTAIANYYTKTEIGTLLDGKVDKETGKGLSTNDYDNTAKGIVDGVTNALAGKVDKVNGKGLSTEDYTTTEKNKLAGISTNANKVEASTTNGNIKIDDVETQVYDGSGKADKVTNATNGNLAGLNGSGNLTDSTWSADKTTQSATGNPISITGLKSNQLAINPIITLEPIQAGSGTPSPSNIRAISGYDKVEVESCGKNLCDNSNNKTGGYYNASGSWVVDSSHASSGLIPVVPNTTYRGCMYNKNTKQPINDVVYVLWSDETTGTGQYTSSTITTGADTKYITIRNYGADASYIQNNNFLFALELGDTSSTIYPEYNKTTDLSESLGQTVYGLTHEVRTGKAKVTYKSVDMGDLDYYRVSDNVFTVTISDKKSGSGRMYCSCFDYEVNKGYALDSDCISDSNVSGYATTVFIKTTASYSSSALLKTAVTGQTLVYTLATPTEIQLTPHEISLLKDYAYVSTNGTSISLDYHNGELASLADVSQLGETVNELGDSLKRYILTGELSDTINTPIYFSYPTGLNQNNCIVLRAEYNVGATSPGIWSNMNGADVGIQVALYGTQIGIFTRHSTALGRPCRIYLEKFT